MDKILFYISGHGYGHATRMCEVMRALYALSPNTLIYVRTTAPSELFSNLSDDSYLYERVAIDSGVVERPDALSVDVPSTLHAIDVLAAKRNTLIASEASFVAKHEISLIVADIPYLAGDIATCVGVPCIGVGNFLWNWIYEPYFSRDKRYVKLRDSIRESYARMTAFLQLPFAHKDGLDSLRLVVPIPLIAKKSTRSRSEVDEALGLNPNDTRHRVLLAMRGVISQEVFNSAANANPNFLFLQLHKEEHGSPENLKSISLSPRLHFSDVLLATDFVVAKLGYGILSECIANGKGILCPRRIGFREDEILFREAPSSVRLVDIGGPEFRRGEWSSQLAQLVLKPAPTQTLGVHGAETCAQFILSKLEAVS